MSARAAKWNTRSTPAVAAANAAPSATSPSMIDRLELPLCCLRLARRPTTKLSNARTARPCASKRSTRWLPMKPAPPVTKSIPVGGATSPPLSGASLCGQKLLISSTDGWRLSVGFRKGFAACFRRPAAPRRAGGDRDDRQSRPYGGRRPPALLIGLHYRPRRRRLNGDHGAGPRSPNEGLQPGKRAHGDEPQRQFDQHVDDQRDRQTGSGHQREQHHARGVWRIERFG